MKHRYILLLPFLLLLACHQGVSQNTANMVQSEAYEKEINRWLSGTVPFIAVDQLKDKLGDYQILDAREISEYNISHIPGAKFAGYNSFKVKKLEGIDKTKPVVVYCSIGYRSEKVGEKLRKAGYTEVYNLYGSIFEWANKGLELENESGQKTNQIHGYDKNWSKWVTNPDIEKTW